MLGWLLNLGFAGGGASSPLAVATVTAAKCNTATDTIAECATATVTFSEV